MTNQTEINDKFMKDADQDDHNSSAEASIDASLDANLGNAYLPAELIILIASFLSSAYDFISLSCVSQRFHRILLQPKPTDHQNKSSQWLNQFVHEEVSLSDGHALPSLAFSNNLPNGVRHGRETRWEITRYTDFEVQAQLHEIKKQMIFHEKIAILATDDIIVVQKAKAMIQSLVDKAYAYLYVDGHLFLGKNQGKQTVYSSANVLLEDGNYEKGWPHGENCEVR